MVRQTMSETMDVYNCPVSKGKEMDTNGIDRLADVRENKLNAFIGMFDAACGIQDLKSKKVILKDRSVMRNRYLTTFRESGPSLQGRVNLRVLFVDPKKDSVGFALDYETHSNLVTPAGKVILSSLNSYLLTHVSHLN